jgi:hypothetical protein
MSIRHTIAILAAACIGTPLMVELAGAAIYHVSPLGSNTPPYDTYAKAAHRVIDAARAATADSDTILVHPGEYLVDTIIPIGKGVVWQGTSRDSVELYTEFIFQQEYFTMSSLGGGNAISGITFRDRSGVLYPNAWAMNTFTQDSVTIWDCRFVAATMYLSGGAHFHVHDNEIFHEDDEGVDAQLGYFWIHHNTFHGSLGYSVFLEDARTALIEYNSFSNEGFPGIPIALSAENSRSVMFRNNLLTNTGGFDWFHSTGIIENNTLSNTGLPSPSFPHRSQFFVRTPSTLTIRGNAFVDILRSKIGCGCWHTGDTTGTITVVNNSIWPPADSLYAFEKQDNPSAFRILDSANYSLFPMFAHDSVYELQFGSPLVDAGDPSVLDSDGSRSDIGWTGGPGGYTYPYLDLSPLPPETLGVSGEDTLVSVRWSSRPEGDLAGYRLYRGDHSGFWSPGLIPTHEFQVTATDTLEQVSRQTDTLYYVVTSFDRAGHESDPSAEVRYMISDNPFNQPPTWLPIAPQEIAVGDSLTLRVSATDPDGDLLSLTAGQLPPNAVFIDSGSGVGGLEFFPDSSQVGVLRIEFIASDGDLSDSIDFSINVTGSAVSLPQPGIVSVYPNPLNGNGHVEVMVPGDAGASRSVKLILHDLLGRNIAMCYEGELSGGKHLLEIDLTDGGIGLDLASGVYFLRLQDERGTIGRMAKIAVVK